MSWNSFGNFMSARSSALAEFGNMVANLVSAKNEKDISKRNEYYKQAGYSALLAFGNLASNIAPGSTSSHIVNGTNASVIASRLSGNISSAIQEHKDGKVNINRFQNILADLYSLGGLGSTLIEKNGNMQSWGIPLAIAGDIIAATAIATGDTGTISTEEFYNFDNWKGFGYELFEDWSRWVYDWLPDGWNLWKELDRNRSGQYHIYDPLALALALDLDGDGIETVAAKGFSGSLFDHNGNGIRTATGWVSADDGLLVRDLNGNGIIDNGAELFGDNTKLADGSFAKHGYAALAELDSNGDNIINAADAAFQSLRVWQDLNQDGISQANELRTLEELGIQSLDLAYKDVNKNLGNGNTLAQQGSYTKTDGTTAKMGDLLLAADNLHSRFTNKMLSISHVRENTISPFVLGCLNK
nr:calcium-binding protein [Neisseria meningitidis]